MKSIIRTVPLALAALLPVAASAAYGQTVTNYFSYGLGFGTGTAGSCTGYGLQCVAGQIVSIINGVLVPLLFAIAFIAFLWGIASAYILHPGDEEAVRSGHRLILWGIIGFAVMISLWGLVNVVSNTFGLTGQTVPNLPSTIRP